jgi:hypothetical protein
MINSLASRRVLQSLVLTMSSAAVLIVGGWLATFMLRLQLTTGIRSVAALDLAVAGASDRLFVFWSGSAIGLCLAWMVILVAYQKGRMAFAAWLFTIAAPLSIGLGVDACTVPGPQSMYQAIPMHEWDRLSSTLDVWDRLRLVTYRPPELAAPPFFASVALSIVALTAGLHFCFERLSGRTLQRRLGKSIAQRKLDAVSR